MSITNGSSDNPDEAVSLYAEQSRGSAGQTLVDYLYMLWKGKWAILGIVVLIGGATYFYYKNQPRTYKASSAVLINAEEGPERMAEFLPTQPSNRLGRELYFLRNSQGFSRKVARRLASWQDSLQAGQEASLLWTQGGGARGEEALASMVQSKVRVRRDAQEVPAIRISVTSSHPKEAAVVVNAYAEVYREYLYRSGNAQMRATRQFLQEQQQELEDKLQEIEDSIDARIRASGQLGVSASGQDGGGIMGKAQQLTEKISDLEVKKSQVQIDLEMEQALLDSARARLRRIRPNLADRAASTTPDKLKQTQRQIAELEADIQAIRMRNESLSAPMKAEVGKMRARLEELRGQADRLAQTYVEQALSSDAINPLGEGGGLSSVVNLKQEMTKRRISITRLEAKRRVLTERLAEHRASLRQSPDRTLARLRRRKSTTKELFVSLSKSLQRAQVSEESAPEQASIVRKADPPLRPIAPNMWNKVILAVLMGGMGGCGLVLTYNRLDDTIREPTDMESGRHEVFGTIAEWETDLELATSEDGDTWPGVAAPFSPAAEEYRHLATNVRLGLPHDVTTLLVTSPHPKEGKTTTAANLAVTLSESGKDVLLVGADLRGATLHRAFGIERSPGLTDRLAGSEEGIQLLRSAPLRGENGKSGGGDKEEGIQGSIHETQQEQVGRLGVLPAGAAVPQPGLLLQDAHLQSLLETLETSWEVILIDSPPALLYDDVFRIAALSDLVLLLAAAGNTQRSAFGEVRSRLETVCPRSVVSLLNFHQQISSPGYGYGDENGYYRYADSSSQKSATRAGRFRKRISDGVQRILKG